MTTCNGGFYDYNNRTSQDIFFRKGEDRATKTITVKSGQVLKARSFLQSDSEGKHIAHTGLSEVVLVTFATITTGQTLILGGLTFTAGSGSVTAAQLVEIWRDLADGTGYAAAAIELLARGINATTVGTFTAGTLTGWNTQNHDAVSKVLFTSTTALTNVTDLADTGTATNPTVTTVGGATSFVKPTAVNLYDIDASGGDVQVEAFTEASFWASALNWYADPTVDTITIHDGTTVACTAYNTGTVGYDKASTELLQAKFVEGSEFDNLGFLTEGEIYNG